MAILLSNKRGLHDYTVIDTWECGLKLLGNEVKSLRNSRGSLDGSWVSTRTGELWLRKSYIPPYQEKNTQKGYDAHRERKLLLKKQDINKLIAKLEKDRATLVPIDIHTRSNGFIGITIALAKKTSKYDHRQKIKSRDTERELARELKGRVKV